MDISVSIKDVLKRMRDPDIFSIRWIELDQYKKTGGRIRSMESAICLNGKAGKGITSPTSVIRKPRHKANRTLNIRESLSGLEIGHIYKIHPNLILEFNGKKVYLS